LVQIVVATLINQRVRDPNADPNDSLRRVRIGPPPRTMRDRRISTGS
jgi:hypothetical protein